MPLLNGDTVDSMQCKNLCKGYRMNLSFCHQAVLALFLTCICGLPAGHGWLSRNFFQKAKKWGGGGGGGGGGEEEEEMGKEKFGEETYGWNHLWSSRMKGMAAMQYRGRALA